MSDDNDADLHDEQDSGDDRAIDNYPHGADEDPGDVDGAPEDDGAEPGEDGDHHDDESPGDGGDVMDETFLEIATLLDEMVSQVELAQQREEKYGGGRAGNDDAHAAPAHDSELLAAPADHGYGSDDASSPRPDETEEERLLREERDIFEEVAFCVSELVDTIEFQVEQEVQLEMASKREAAFDIFNEVESQGKRHNKARAHALRHANDVCRELVLDIAHTAVKKSEQRKKDDGEVESVLSELVLRVAREHDEAQAAADRQEVTDVVFDLVDRVVEITEMEERKNRAIREQVLAERRDEIALEEDMTDEQIVANVLDDAVDSVALAESIFAEIVQETAAAEVTAHIRTVKATAICDDLSRQLIADCVRECVAEGLAAGLISEVMNEVAVDVIEDIRIENIVAQRLREMVNNVAFKEEAKAAVANNFFDKNYSAALLKSLPFIRPRAAKWLSKARAAIAKRQNRPAPAEPKAFKPNAKALRAARRDQPVLRPAEAYQDVAAIERAAAEVSAVTQCMEWMLDEVEKTAGQSRRKTTRSRDTNSTSPAIEEESETDTNETSAIFYPEPTEAQIQKLTQARWQKMSQVAARKDSSLGDLVVIVGDVEETADTLYPSEQQHPALMPYSTEIFLPPPLPPKSTADPFASEEGDTGQVVDPYILKQQSLARNRDCVSKLKCIVM